MAIKFKVIERGEPGVVGGGTKKFYAMANTTGEATIERLTRQIEKISTVSGADIRAVLYAMVDVAVEELADGKVVRLDDLGSLRVSVSSMGIEKESDVTATAITKARVVFYPGKKIKNMLNNLKYVKM